MGSNLSWSYTRVGTIFYGCIVSEFSNFHFFVFVYTVCNAFSSKIFFKHNQVGLLHLFQLENRKTLDLITFGNIFALL